MLQNMHIKNIALIDEIDIGFDENLNILTGETGAGKSIIIGSIGICLGGKFPKELLRDGQQDGLVELLFSVQNRELADRLSRLDIVLCEEGELLISRRLSPAGRTVNRVNDSTVTTARLKEIAAVLIDLHAQHEQQTLLKADRHLAILDRFGGCQIEEKKRAVKSLYEEYTAAKKEITEKSMDDAEKNKRLDFLKYQINEIRSAGLVDGEDEELELRYKKISNAQEILATADEIYRMTGYDSSMSAAETIGHAARQLVRLTELDPALTGTSDLLQDIDGMLNDFNREFSQYMKSMEFDGQELAEVETRLNLINGLKAKYGSTIGQILHSCEEYEEEYNRMVSYDEYMQELALRLSKVTNELALACDVLTEIRKTYAGKLCEKIREALGELNFMTVCFDMHFKKEEHYSANGNDTAYFMISTNIGEPMRPLYEVASGGELSRVMLALKSCLAGEDDTPTLVFDEIDVGISGRTAQKVAEKLSVIAGSHQVICITHLPQIAAMADSHYVIEKNVEKNKTVTGIRKLNKEEEIEEIARLLGGAEITDNVAASAREMKGLADRTKIY